MLNKLFIRYKNKTIKVVIYVAVLAVCIGGVYLSYQYADATTKVYFELLGMVGGLILLASLPSLMKQRKKRNLLSIFKNSKDFHASKAMLSYDLKSAIAIDEKNKKICLVLKVGSNITNKILSFEDLLSSEIIENSDSITKTARGSQIGGAIIGSVLLGGAGAIIGGLSGKKHQINKIKNIDLQILINDMKSPIFTMNFLSVKNTNSFSINNGKDNKDGYSKDSETYNNCIFKATKWHSLLKVIINDTDKKDNTTIQRDDISFSVADEIKKLKSLLDDELLTKEEFLSQKEKLLNS